MDREITLNLDDLELERVARWFEERDPTGRGFGLILRTAFDEALDGARTGRFDPLELRKVEKTFIGTRVELGLAREFNLADGTLMDFTVDGIEVDAKYSGFQNGWQIPPEAIGHLCLLLWSDDHRSQFSVGVVRIAPDRLGASNRDGKRPLNQVGRSMIRWIWHKSPLPENLLLHLSDMDRAAVLARRVGQARVDELFRRVHGRLVWREAVVTVARQADPARRVRTAREHAHLGREGIVILGHYGNHQYIADALGLPIPRLGEWVAVRLTSVDTEVGRHFVMVGGASWSIARPGDPVTAAPHIPHAPEDD